MRGPHLLLRQHTQPPEVVAFSGGDWHQKFAPAKQRQRPPENAFSPLCGVLASSTDSARSAQRQVCFAGSTHSPQCLRNARAGKRSAQANATPLTGKGLLIGKNAAAAATDRPATQLLLPPPQTAPQRNYFFLPQTAPAPQIAPQRAR